ncbi:MAG: SHOCT domain-containing protein, partial [Nitrososphaeraceae archaeon]
LKFMVISTIKDGKAYTIGFGGPSNSYDNYIETAQKMINSFQITEAGATNPADTLSITDNSSSQDDPLVILKTRLAKGEISAEEYEQLKQIITAK